MLNSIFGVARDIPGDFLGDLIQSGWDSGKPTIRTTAIVTMVTCNASGALRRLSRLILFSNIFR